MKFKLILVLILSNCLMGFSQKPFAPLGAKWHYSASAQGAAPTGAEYYLYESVLDTVVATYSCKKISVTYYKYHNGDTAYLPPVFVYQSQSLDTVFYYNAVYSRYFPLYIFNVLPGDTITYHSRYIPYNPADTLWQSVVDSVSNLVVGKDTLKQIWTNEPNLNAYSFWGGYMEKLGCPFLMLHQPHTIYPEWDGPMRCYSDSNISYNLNAFPCDFRLTTGISEILNEFEVTVFPNPATDYLTIRSQVAKPIDFKIYNLSGQLIKGGSFQSSTFVLLDHFSSGLYNIEFTTNNKIKRQSFIVEK